MNFNSTQIITKSYQKVNTDKMSGLLTKCIKNKKPQTKV